MFFEIEFLQCSPGCNSCFSFPSTRIKCVPPHSDSGHKYFRRQIVHGLHHPSIWHRILKDIWNEAKQKKWWKKWHLQNRKHWAAMAMSPRDRIPAMYVSLLLFLQLQFLLPKLWKSWQPITLNCRTHVIALSIKEPSHPRSCHLFKGQRGRPNKCLAVLM